MLDHLWVSGDGLAALAPLTNLADLTLAHMLVRDDDLAAVRAFPKLRRLRLARTAVTGGGILHLAGLANLRDLDLSEAVQLDAVGVRAAGSWACPATGPAWLTLRLVPRWGRRHNSQLAREHWYKNWGVVTVTE